MKVVLHGKLRNLFGPEFEIGTEIPADAIEGVSRQLPGWPRDMLVDVVGFETETKLRAKTKVTEIHLVPAISGGGGVARIIIGVAMIAAIVFSGGTWTPLAILVLSTGVSLVLSGAMMLFYKSPTLHKSEDPAASKYFGNSGNTTAIGTYRIIAYGKTKVAGHWLSIQVDEKSLVMGRFPSSPPA